MSYIHIIYQSRVTATRTSNGEQVFVKNCKFSSRRIMETIQHMSPIFAPHNNFIMLYMSPKFGSNLRGLSFLRVALVWNYPIYILCVVRRAAYPKLIQLNARNVNKIRISLYSADATSSTNMQSYSNSSAQPTSIVTRPFCS